MTKNELLELKKRFIELSAYYDKQLTDVALAMYCEDLSDLIYEDVIDAMRIYRRSVKNKTFPLPSQLREIIQPEVSEIDDANEVANRIIAASQGRHRGPVGELAQRVVELYGGWDIIGEGQRSENGILRAQLRDLAISIQHKVAAGEFGPPGLPSRKFKSLSRREQENQFQIAKQDQLNKLEAFKKNLPKKTLELINKKEDEEPKPL